VRKQPWHPHTARGDSGKNSGAAGKIAGIVRKTTTGESRRKEHLGLLREVAGKSTRCGIPRNSGERINTELLYVIGVNLQDA